MSHHLGAVDQIDQATHDCITDCATCHDLCMATIRHCLERGGEHASPGHILALLDCAQACDASRDFMLRGSQLHHHYCGACAEACERCAAHCEALGDGDAVMRACAEACRRCAQSCREMAHR